MKDILKSVNKRRNNWYVARETALDLSYKSREPSELLRTKWFITVPFHVCVSITASNFIETFNFVLYAAIR